ncbi:tannase and feruloyl esterase-domain-containing protein [Tricladium varicosporioides]|nr:tannase and feruloyl esterase-domain-containing protein [Hymenoscyphus varicosporioides]
MNQMKEYPHPCEFAAITAAAIEACDGDDGVVDGIISDPEKCKFETKTLVGKKIKMGGKMITYHVLADPAIPPGGSKNYYDKVLKMDGNAHDFYRLFLDPGLSHCWGGPGPYPETTFDALKEWVENGVAPEVLDAKSVPVSEGRVLKRPLCPYPKQQYYNGRGDLSMADSFYCK